MENEKIFIISHFYRFCLWRREITRDTSGLYLEENKQHVRLWRNLVVMSRLIVKNLPKKVLEYVMYLKEMLKKTMN